MKRTTVETVLLADMKQKLLAPEVVAYVCKEAPKRLAGAVEQRESSTARIAEFEAENARLTESCDCSLGPVARMWVKARAR